MKKILFTVAAALTMVSCSQDDLMQGVENRPTGAIGANVFVPTVARGTALNEVGDLVTTQNGFDLYAFLSDGSQFMGESDGNNNNDGIAFQGAGTESYTWNYVDESEMRFWSEANSQNITFYAVSPMNEITTNTPFTNSGSLKKNLTAESQTLEYTVPTTCSEQVDLMYAATEAYSSESGEHLKSGVDLQFHHALSQIVFRAKTETALIEADITKIEIKNLYGSGTFDMQTKTWSYGDEASATSSYVAYLGESNPINIRTIYNEDGGYNTTNEEGNYTNGWITDRTEALLLIPQNTSENGTKISVTCNVRFIKESETEIEKVTIVDNQTFDVSVFNEWQPGFKYIYTLIFTTDMGNPIKVNAVGVDNWDVVYEDKYIPEKFEVSADGNFYIYSAEQLAEIRDNINNNKTYSYNGAVYYYKEATYIQKADIDLSEYATWTPIGNSENVMFEGDYDGGNHKIQNLTIVGEENNLHGLFGKVGNANIKNINIVELKAYGTNVAGIACEAYNTTIENCTVNGVFGSNEVLTSGGGIISNIQSNGHVINCINYAEATNVYDFGGIAETNAGIIARCVNYGNISAPTSPHNEESIGGIVNVNAGDCFGCYNVGNLTGNIRGMGGIVGNSHPGRCNIISCYNIGKIENSNQEGEVGSWYNRTGAIIGGDFYNPTVESCYFNNENLSGIGYSESSHSGGTQITDNTWESAKIKMNNSLYTYYTNNYQDACNIKYVDNTVEGAEPLTLASGAEYIEETEGEETQE